MGCWLKIPYQLNSYSEYRRYEGREFIIYSNYNLFQLSRTP